MLMKEYRICMPLSVDEVSRTEPAKSWKLYNVSTSNVLETGDTNTNVFIIGH